MPTSEKCVHSSFSDNLNGKQILLTINKYDQKTLEIVIKYVLQNNSRRKYPLLFLIVILNSISYIFNVVSTKYFIIILTIVITFVYRLITTVQQEKVLIVQSLGYQIETQNALGKTIRYVTWQNIKSVFINEVISRHKVVFILAILTKEHSKEPGAILQLFIETMPRLSCLEIVYRHIESCHY